MYCDKCKKKIDHRDIREDCLPCGMSFELDNGQLVTLCADCLRILGRTDRKGARAFAESIGVRYETND